MKTILFCNLPYSFSILKPLADELNALGHEYIWYVPKNIVENFAYEHEKYTSSIKDLEDFKSDTIFVPGNDVPYWLQGLKVQIFHGLAGEKKGHFRIRDYFDLYLTQGPYFTEKFEQLAKSHKNFDVIETGWCKLDNLYNITQEIKDEKKSLLASYNAKHIVLYSPTFSPKLTSAYALKEIIVKLGENKDVLCIIKFHDKMDTEIKEEYAKLKDLNIVIKNDSDITPYLQMSDLMLSDTSSVVYEFMLLDKPVITLNSTSSNISWSNHIDTQNIYNDIIDSLSGNDTYAQKRQKTIQNYHPYNDSKSTSRMIKETKQYIQLHSVPKKRKISFFRKLKSRKSFGA
jgi:hypothetical protein